MTEPLLRIAYIAISIYTFASALLTCTILNRSSKLSAVELLSVGGVWVSFVAFVLIVSWASKVVTKHPGQKLAESLLRVSFLAMGLFFCTCAVASTLALTYSNAGLQYWFCVGGLWFSFVTFSGVMAFASKAKPLAHRVDAAADLAPSA